jgi:glucose 1-dehydrogenase
VSTIPHRLAGRFALVTGSSRGIGLAVAVRFAQEGAIVAINHRNDPEDADKALARLHEVTAAAGLPKVDHRIVGADVAWEGDIERAIGELVSGWGRLDILVNNAGIQSETPGDEMSDDDVSKILDVNLKGPALASRVAIRHFLSRPGGGVIINTSSVHEAIPKPGYAAYAMSKAGLGHLTRTLALEFAEKGIRVNAIGPGATVTPINRAWIDDPVKRDQVTAHIPMGRAGLSEEMAATAAFLLSDEAGYITGQTLYVDGGLTLFADFRSTWSSE